MPLALHKAEIPIIAAVNGPAIGAGFDLACLCDLRLGSSKALFGETFINLGIVPGDGGAWFLKRQLSYQRAAELSFTLWSDACDQYCWFLHNPFTSVKKHLPQTPALRREGFRFDEWRSFLDHIDPWYQPVAELMILTGMIHSELGGLTKDDIFPDYIHVRQRIVRGRQQTTLKTRFRNRQIPITRAIRQRLDLLMARTEGDRLITTKSGTIFRSANFNKDIWEKAQQASGMTDKVPYALRHTFAAWALMIGIDMNQLMGHASKQMVYEVYGEYIEGLEEDREDILEYFGADFLAPKRTARSRHHAGESSCERHPEKKRNP